jgi:hypothetical protein
MAAAPLPADQRIADLRATLERTRANLVELDADVTRKTLESSTTLEGRTAEIWSRASRQFASLWQGQLTLDSVLEEIVSARGTRASIPKSALGHLHELLNGTPVALPRTGPDAAARSLTEGTTPNELLSIDEVITRMSDEYSAVITVVDAVHGVWSEILPELESLQATVTDLERLAAQIGAHRPNQLGLARRMLDEHERSARNDPLAVSAEVLSSLRTTVDQAGAPIRQAIDAAGEVEGDLQAVQASLDDCRRSLTRVRTDLERPETKVAVPSGATAAVDEIEADLARWQDQCDAVRRTASTRPIEAKRAAVGLAHALAGLQHRIDELGSFEAAGVATRDELRGRLAALRAKAQATGRNEDPELDRIHDAARDILFSAPCDLQRAESLVGEYQQTLRSIQSGTQ